MIDNGYVVLLFYASIAFLIYYFRDNFEFEGIVALYKTSWGLDLMNKVAKVSPRLLRFLSVTGILVGYVVMIGMFGIIWIGIQNLIYRPEAPAAFTPIIPGVDIPGSPIDPPLLEPIIAIFIVVVIHEFAHGVTARLYDIDVKSSGFVLFGPLPGAFVEPDEEQLENASQEASQGMFAAGPYWNILLGIPVFFLVVAGIGFTDQAYTGDGVYIEATGNVSNTSQRLGSLSQGDIITAFNGSPVRNISRLGELLQKTKPNQTVSVTTKETTTTVRLGESRQGDYGVPAIRGSTSHVFDNTWQAEIIRPVEPLYFFIMGDYRVPMQSEYLWFGYITDGPDVTAGLLGWVFIITTGIAGANLLPIGPLDGGRMWFKTLKGVFSEETALRIASFTTWTLFIIVLILLVVPMVQPFI